MSFSSIIFGPLSNFGSSEKEAINFKDRSSFIEEYCYDCHGEGANKGDFAMDELIALGDFSKHSKKWERVWKNIYNRICHQLMYQPFDPEISKILSWIEETSFEHDPSKAILVMLF